MIETLSSIDQQLLLAVNSANTPALDQFMWLVSARTTWIPLYIVVFALLVRQYGWKLALCLALGAGLAVAVADQVCATFIRPLVERLRPANLDNPLSPLVHIVHGYRGGRYGFPSCHAANTFAAAMFLTLAFPRRVVPAIALFAWALLNCWSRMYLGVHYPGDLLVGGLIGAGAGAGIYLAMRYVLDRFFNLGLGVNPAGAGSSINLAYLHLPQVSVANTTVLAGTGATTVVILLGLSLLTFFL